MSTHYALAGVNTSTNYIAPSGYLATIDVNRKKIIARCDLGGQPDSVAVSPNNSYVAIAIENERDEELNGGALPQLPAGHLTVIPLKNGRPQCLQKYIMNMSYLSDIGGSDPEPEFVDICCF